MLIYSSTCSQMGMGSDVLGNEAKGSACLLYNIFNNMFYANYFTSREIVEFVLTC